MKTLLAVAFASLILLAGCNAEGFATVKDIQDHTVGSQTGMCGQHMVQRLHVELSGQKYFVFVAPDTQRIVIATVIEKGEEISIGVVTYAEVGPNGKIKVLDTHPFGEKDSPGPCAALYPEIA